MPRTLPVQIQPLYERSAMALPQSRSSASQLVFEQIGYGLVGGVVAGAVGGIALQIAAGRRLIEPHWLQILSLSAAGTGGGRCKASLSGTPTAEMPACAGGVAGTRRGSPREGWATD